MRYGGVAGGIPRRGGSVRLAQGCKPFASLLLLSKAGARGRLPPLFFLEITLFLLFSAAE